MHDFKFQLDLPSYGSTQVSQFCSIIDFNSWRCIAPPSNTTVISSFNPETILQKPCRSNYKWDQVGFHKFQINIPGKLHFTTLNYTSDYTLHPKLFGCTFCTLNYDICYTLHLGLKFSVILDGNLNLMSLHVTLA